MSPHASSVAPLDQRAHAHFELHICSGVCSTICASARPVCRRAHCTSIIHRLLHRHRRQQRFAMFNGAAPPPQWLQPLPLALASAAAVDATPPFRHLTAADDGGPVLFSDGGGAVLMWNAISGACVQLVAAVDGGGDGGGGGGDGAVSAVAYGRGVGGDAAAGIVAVARASQHVDLYGVAATLMQL
jgi:hypothetical protein